MKDLKEKKDRDVRERMTMKMKKLIASFLGKNKKQSRMAAKKTMNNAIVSQATRPVLVCFSKILCTRFKYPSRVSQRFLSFLH